MISTSFSKRQKMETNTDVKVTNIDSIAVVSPFVTSKLSCPEDVVNTFIHVFTEDFLPEIFDNLDILSVKDLLNFRLVNRCWREAASCILLKRNLGMINLNFGNVALDKYCNTFGPFGLLTNNAIKNIAEATIPSSKYFNCYRPKSVLSELSELISTSPKFPCNNIFFGSNCSWYGLENLNPPSGCADSDAVADFKADADVNVDFDADADQQDLFHFLSLYWKKVKKLSLSSEISKKAIQYLLYVHLPHVTCLDLQYFEHFSIEDETFEETQAKICISPSSKHLNSKTTLEIKKLVVGYDPEDAGKPNVGKLIFFEELINVSPNLSVIEDVNVSALGVLLRTGKSHLIKSLYLDPTPAKMSIVEQFTTVFTSVGKNNLQNSPPTQSKLIVQFHNVLEWNDYDMSNEALQGVSTVLNLILSANKNSLKEFELYMNLSSTVVNIFIPSLPRLKCLRLFDNESAFATQIHFLGDIIGRGIKDRKVTTDQLVNNVGAHIFKNQTNCNIPAEYFPRLSEVSLKIGEFGNNPGKLLDFFSLEHLGPELEPDGATILPGDTLLAVTSLELIANSPFNRNVSKLFPNVTCLNIHSDFSSILHNWLWNSFPKLERLEISGMINGWETKEVDSFFTGISRELCATFDREETITELEPRTSQDLLVRTQPYIRDCENLKEFKIKFWKQIKSKFALKVTSDHGFQEVLHRTKIIFSFEDMTMSVDQINETLRYMDPVAAYVEIRMKQL